MNHTISDEQIEQLAWGQLTTHQSIEVQRHIYHCPDCLKKLISITYAQELAGLGPKPLSVSTSRKPLSFLHDTADGFIYANVESRGRNWVARHWGEQLDGMRVFPTMREANRYVVASFNEMFPEHRCTERCRAQLA